MKKNIIVMAFIVISLFVFVVGISLSNFYKPKGDNLDELFVSTNLDQMKDNTLVTLDSSIKESTNQEMTPEEMVAATQNYPSYAIDWNEDDIIEYNGGEITTEITVTNGSFKIEKGFTISIDGVLQECIIKSDGIKTERSFMPIVVLNAGEVKSFEISFIPNIGNKNDCLEMSLIHSYLPNYRITEDMEVKVILGQENRALSALNKTLKFNVDSSKDKNITNNFSGAKIDKLNKVLYSSHYYENAQGDLFNDTYESNRIVLYHDFYKVYSVTEGVYHDDVERFASMTVQRADKVPLTINLYGKPGKRRVCLLINNELQPVFDDKYYADIEFKEGEQVELFVEIDTLDLDKYNCIYAFSKELNEVIDSSDHLLRQSDPYVLIVE